METAARHWLENIAADVMAHQSAGSFRVADTSMVLPADRYTHAERFQEERQGIFRRLPLMLAASCELGAVGDYKAMEVAGVPVLLTRDTSGRANALVNICTHRGAPLVEGVGRAGRFVCPYHGWTFTNDGRLAAVASAADFGDLDKSRHGLTRLPIRERDGLIWVVLDPQSTLDIDTFLGTFGDALAGFGLASWRLIEQRTLPGANWKLAFDAHLEFYHLPVLHRNTFGATANNQALYYFEGPHQRLIRPVGLDKPGIPTPADLFAWRDRNSTEWPVEAMLLGEWIVFPNVSINSFYNGGRGVLISQIFPGPTVDTSFTVQSYYMQDEPDAEQQAAAEALCAFLAHVVGDEDLANSFRQQRALASGLLPEVCFGRNEGGGQHFHRWLDRLLGTPEQALAALFADRDPITACGNTK